MTIKDLAAKTGYAVGTVSRALNDHPNVSEKARTAILQAAEESGFQLNVNAKQLKQQHSTTILGIMKGTSNEFFADMVVAIQNMIAETRYQLVMDFMEEDLNEVRRAVQLCREKKPLGILFLGGNHEHFTRDFGMIDIPCVLVTGDASVLAFDNLSSVSTDDREAGRKAVEQLISMGHRRISIIGGDRETSDISKLRYEGCMDAFRAHGIPFDSERDYQGGHYTYEDGYRAVRALIDKGSQFSAIFAMADVMSIGAIRALQDAGLRVPEDVSIIGVDGLPLGRYIIPRLATVQQSFNKIAERSVEILLGGIEEGTPACHETVPFQLMHRESLRAFRES